VSRRSQEFRGFGFGAFFMCRSSTQNDTVEPTGKTLYLLAPFAADLIMLLMPTIKPPR
jgi:hypothetical protein